MEMKPLFLTEALDIMNRRCADGSFYPFDVDVRTFNSQTGKGGKYITYRNVRLLPEANHDKSRKVTMENVLDDRLRKRPNHYENRTRNIEFVDGTVKTIRIDFIIRINNQYVIY